MTACMGQHDGVWCSDEAVLVFESISGHTDKRWTYCAHHANNPKEDKRFRWFSIEPLLTEEDFYKEMWS